MLHAPKTRLLPRLRPPRRKVARVRRKVVRMRRKTEARLQIEGDARPKERAEELSISKSRAVSESSVAEKRVANEAAPDVEDCKRRAV